MRSEHARELAGGEFDALRPLLDDLEASDLELLDPPPAIWDGIEASVASATTRRAPDRVGSSPMVVEYVIDDRDVVTGVGGGWADFARDNGAAELVSPPVDRTLWSYFDQSEIRELWQMVVTHVRTQGSEARLPFRCDAPEARRWFEMSVEATSDGSVRFRSELVFEEPREPIALLDPGVERDPDAASVTVCTWCSRGLDDDRWLEIDELLRIGRLLERDPLPPVSWGICRPCRDDMTAELLVAGGITDATA